MIINTNIKDINLLKALYNGNHLNDIELNRVDKLLFLLNKELKERLK